MPLWVQIIIAAAAVVTAIGILWTKVLKPGAQMVVLLTELAPILKDLHATFQGKPPVFDVLNEIAVQFRTDSGSSLRDVVNRLEAAANENRVATEAARLLNEQAHKDRQLLTLVVDRLGIRVDEGLSTKEK